MNGKMYSSRISKSSGDAESSNLVIGDGKKWLIQLNIKKKANYVKLSNFILPSS